MPSQHDLPVVETRANPGFQNRQRLAIPKVSDRALAEEVERRFDPRLNDFMAVNSFWVLTGSS
ncbi:MAG TPA: hypothetical protein VGY99_18435 [Candidatus Binataceae bacterium]|nr:hypothetical protein [Candidatus Binataceae bacterium]